jgi:hypothetical protein
MTLGRFSLITTVVLSFAAAAIAGPVTHVLDTNSYNFQLNGGGGGAQATLDKSQAIEIFCVDFANDIYVPQQNYSAYLTTITGGSNLSYTRFGNVASSNWTQMNTADVDLADATTINTASDLGRYQMAAYLVSQYNIPGGNNAANNGIQQAIWDVLDPNTFSQDYNTSTDNAIEGAAKWYSSMGGNGGSNALNTFLTNYRIVSSTTMTACASGTGLLCGGFQEQITVVPEPRHVALMLMGLLIAGSVVFRKLQAARRSDT